MQFALTMPYIRYQEVYLNRQVVKNTQSGFTIIELIAVIVILGVLAATALPKFASLTSDARIAALNGAKGSLAAAAGMAHGKYLVAATIPASVTYEGVTVTFATVVASGYPKANAAGLAVAAGLPSGVDFQIVGGAGAAVGATANTPAVSATEIAFIPNSLQGLPAGLTCYVKYTEPVTTTGVPTIAVTSTTC